MIMYDSIDLNQIPPDAPAVAGYADGNWPTAVALAARFPHAQRLTIAVNAAHDADCLDIEQGDATPESAAGWYGRQRARSVERPCLYANVSTMETAIVPVIQAVAIVRSQVRLWTAHYTGAPHICGPKPSCGALSINADGTQWTSRAMDRNLDQSLLRDDFFGTPPPSLEEPMAYVLDTLAHGQAAAIPVPAGKTKAVIYADPGYGGGVAPEIRVGTAPHWNGGPAVKPEWGKPATVSLPAGTTEVTVGRVDTGDDPVTVDFA